MGALVATFAVGMALGFVLGGQGVQRRHASFVLGASIVLMAVGSLGFVLGDGHLAAYFAARLVMGIGSGGLWMGVTFATLERFRGQEYRAPDGRPRRLLGRRHRGRRPRRRRVGYEGRSSSTSG